MTTTIIICLKINKLIHSRPSLGATDNIYQPVSEVAHDAKGHHLDRSLKYKHRREEEVEYFQRERQFLPTNDLLHCNNSAWVGGIQDLKLYATARVN